MLYLQSCTTNWTSKIYFIIPDLFKVPALECICFIKHFRTPGRSPKELKWQRIRNLPEIFFSILIFFSFVWFSFLRHFFILQKSFKFSKLKNKLATKTILFQNWFNFSHCFFSLVYYCYYVPNKLFRLNNSKYCRGNYLTKGSQ